MLNRSDRYLIQLFHGVREVGLYAVAYSISLQSIVVLGVLFRMASGPLLATVWEQQGAEATQRLLYSVTCLYILVAIPAVLGLSILAEPIMHVLVGPEFSDAYTIVPWVVGGAFFWGWRTATIMCSYSLSVRVSFYFVPSAPASSMWG